jgi:adenylate kinase
MVRVVMLSPPGAGKGTHGRWLTQQTGAAHISSGDLLRAEVARGSRLGRQVAAYTARGNLVPDELIFSILIPAVVAAARDTGGYVLDGFPRTMPQALRAAQVGVELGLTSHAVIYLTAPEEELVTRLLDRAQRDGRVDDTLGVIQHRLAVFTRETAPAGRLLPQPRHPDRAEHRPPRGGRPCGPAGLARSPRTDAARRWWLPGRTGRNQREQ